MKQFALILIALLLFSPLCWAAIEGPEATAVNRIAKLRDSTPIADGAKVKRQWRAPSEDVDIVASETGKLLYATSGKPGRYEITLTRAIATADGLTLEDELWTFVVGGAETPDKPEPPAPPKLRDLVDTATAAILADHYATWPQVIPALSSPQAFTKAERAWRTAKDFPGLERFYVAVDKRLATALEKDPWQASIVAELQAIVAELGVDSPLVPTTKTVIAVTYVYEKDKGLPPSAVLSAINRLNRERSIVATTFEEDTVDRDNQTPDQYKAALAEAQRVGLPALVVTFADKTQKAVLDPRTEDEIWSAVP